MERLCKTCKIKHDKLISYCSLECINNDKEFHEICKTAYSMQDAARKCNIPVTSFKRILKKLNITITPKKKEKIVPVKVCPKCNKEHTSKYGVHCSRKCSNARIHSEETRKKMSESSKKFYKENPEAVEKSRERAKNLSPETKEKRSKSLREFYKNNAKKGITKNRISIKTKEQKKAERKARKAAYRARKKNAFSPDADRKLLAKIREHCPEGYHVDHIIPISKGGLEHQDNLQYLPASENFRKKDRLDYIPQGAIRWQDIL